MPEPRAMNQIEAFRDTLTLAQERGMDDIVDGLPDACDYWHLQGMLDEIQNEPERFKDEAKLGRWLGWAMCAVVAGGFATLDEMRAISTRHAGVSGA